MTNGAVRLFVIARHAGKSEVTDTQDMTRTCCLFLVVVRGMGERVCMCGVRRGQLLTDRRRSGLVTSGRWVFRERRRSRLLARRS